MAVRIVQKINVRIPGLKKGVEYLADELRRAGNRIGPYLQAKVRIKQRLDTGQERRRTVYRVGGRGTNVTISVYNTVVQALVDETGAKWGGSMPPYRAGSKLFAWVLRKGIARSFSGSERKYIATFYRTQARRAGAGQEEARQAGRAGLKDALNEQDRQAERVSFLIARSISRRGLPRPGDPLRKPFETTRKEERGAVIAMTNAAVVRAVNRMNNEGSK